MRVGPRVGFGLVAGAFAVAMLGTTLPTPLYPLYEAKYGFSQLLVTVIFATYAAGVIFALLAFGRLSDALGRRPVLAAGLALSALSAAVFLLAHGLALLLLGRLVSGFSAGIFTGTATATLLDLAEPAGLGRARATLLATAVNMLGLGTGPLLAGLLVKAAGAPLRTCFWVDLGLVAAAGAALALAPETVARKDAATIAAARRPRRPGVPEEARGVFLRGALAGFAGFAMLGLFTAVTPAFLGRVLGQKDPVVTGAVVLAVFVASAAGQAAVDLLAPARAFALGCVGLIAGSAVLAVGLAHQTLAGVVAGGVIAGLGQGLSFRAALGSITAASPAPRRAEVSSSFFLVAYVALAGPVVGVGVLAQLADLTSAGLVFCGVVALLAAGVLTTLALARSA